MGRSRRTSRRTRRTLAAAAVAALLVVASPGGRSHLKAAAVALEIVGSPVRPLHVLTPEPRRTAVALPGGRADLYVPRGFSQAPGVVLVHGGNPAGKDDADLVRLARSFAASGRRVLVPGLELRHQRLDPTDPERIRQAVAWLSDGEPVGVLGFSYGAGLAAVALGDRPAAQRDVAFLATVGTYFDPAHIVQGVTTGTVPAGGSAVRWSAAREARDVLAAQLAAFLGGSDEAALRAAWERRDPAGLPPDARAAYDLAANEDPARFGTLWDALPGRVRQLLDEVSPARVAGRLRVPVFALHSHEDGASPPSESQLFVEALPDDVPARLTRIGLLEHVRPQASLLDDLGDSWGLFRHSARLFRMQERWPRP